MAKRHWAKEVGHAVAEALRWLVLGVGRSSKKLWVWVLIGFRVVGIISAAHAVMSTRTAQGAIAWSVSLVAAPVVAVPAYWVFGRNKFEGYVEAWQENEEDFRELIGTIRAKSAPVIARFETPVPEYEALRGLIHTSMTTGNRVELLIDGEATFDSILEGIAAAREYVLVQFYIVRDDGLGRRLKEAMIERAQAGLRVVLLYDEIGSAGLSDSYKQDLVASGVKVSAFNTTQGRRNRFQLNFRNHRKIVVVDGVTTWIGGHNVGDEYLGLDPELSPWRDTHVRIDGPIAIQAQGVIASDWYWAQREVLDLDWTPVQPPDAEQLAMVVATGPADAVETAGLFFVHALNSARERVWITAPYFVPDEAVVKALRLASLRGVDVRVLVPAEGDSLPVQMAAYHYIRKLEGSGVGFCAYGPGFMHQKVLLVDRHTAMVGTHNFDNRSFRLNFEVGALVVDEDFNRQVEAMFLDDLERCVPIDAATFDEKPLHWRFAVELSRLAAPIL